MSISFKNIYHYLKEDARDYISPSERTDISLKRVKLITENQEDFEKDSVYVGKKSFVYRNKINVDGANLILIDDLQEELGISLANTNCFIGLDDKCDLFKEFNRINNLFNIYMRLDTIREANNIQQVADKACDLLENPVIFIDSSYKLLAHASNKPIIDRVWKENIERGYCSYEFISYVRNMKDLKNSLNDSTPFPLNCYKSDIEKYATKFFIRGRLMGYMIVLIEEKEFDPLKKNLAKEISKIAASTYEKSLSRLNLEDLGYENLLMDLLDNKITDVKTLNEKIKIYNESFKSQMVVLLLDISKFNSKKNPAGYISRKLDAILDKRHIYYENKIVVLYDYDEESLAHIKQIKRLKNFAQENNITIGISNSFKDLISSRQYYFQAKKAIELKEKVQLEDSLLYYKDLAFYALLCESQDKEIDISEYIHPVLKELKIHDKLNDTELYVSLYYYLKNNQNAVSTGEDLFLHRNTVKYRLDKIIELTGLDLDNEDQVFNMLFSYRVEAFMKGSKANEYIKGNK